MGECRNAIAAVRVGKARRVMRLRGAPGASGAPDAPDALRRGTHVVVRSDRGVEIATLVEDAREEGAPPVRLKDSDAWMRMGADEFLAALKAEQAAKVAAVAVESAPDERGAEVSFLRRATPADLERANAILEQDEADEFAFFAARVEEMGLPMKPVQVEHLLGGEKILFFYTSEERVDFRGLLRALVARFPAKIELRRIPPREAAAMAGGIGVCGKELCCSTHLKVLKPVTMQMANAQGGERRAGSSDSNLGLCGRLKCCLRYELDGVEKPRCSGCG